MKSRFDPRMERARDAMHLEWLALSAAGKTAGQIGRSYGVRPEHVRTVINRIKADFTKSEAA